MKPEPSATRDSDTGYVFNKDTGAWFSWPGNGTIRSKDKAHLFHYGEIKGWISGYAMLEWQPEVVASEIAEKPSLQALTVCPFPECELPLPHTHELEAINVKEPVSALSADSFGSSEYFKGTLPPHQYPTEEAIERAKILTGPDAPGFDKPWALAIMRGLLAGLSAPSSASEILPAQEAFATLQAAINLTDGHIQRMLVHAYQGFDEWRSKASRSATSLPDVDWLANVIRSANGDHLKPIGAGALAEKIVEAMSRATDRTAP